MHWVKKMNLLNLLKTIINYKGHTKTVNRPFLRLKIRNFTQNGLNTEIRKPELIVSLTSYGERLKDIDFTIYSLLNQTVKPDKVILWLDKEKFNENNLPKKVSKFIKNGLEIKFCRDIKSYTKLIPAMIEYPDAVIVTADDDVYYEKNWLEKLYNSYLKYPQDIHCHRAHRVKLDENNNLLPYESWDKNTNGESVSSLNFLTGVGGVLYPPYCFDEAGLNYNLAQVLAPNADDVWFWLMGIKNERKIRVIKDNITTILSTNILRQLGLIKERTLYSQNKNGGNDEQIKSVLTQYPEIKEKIIKNRSLKVLFDASCLDAYLSKNGYKAGFYNVAMNLLKQFTKIPDFEITLFADYKSRKFIQKMTKDIKDFSDLTVISQDNFINKFIGNINFAIRNFDFKIIYLFKIIMRIYEIYFYTESRKLKKKIDDFDLFFSPLNSPFPEITNNKKIKRFTFLHDIIPLLDNSDKNSLLPEWHYKLFNDLNENDFYFTNSENTRDDFLKHFRQIPSEHIITAHLGADEKFVPQNDIQKISEIKAKYKIPENSAYILSLCTLGKRKNISLLITAFDKFSEQHKDEKICLVLAGGKWKKYEKELSETFSRVNSKNIIQTGYVDDKDLPYLYSGARVFVYPSLYEGFGLPVLEAMKCGCPVIVSNSTSLPEVTGDAGILLYMDNTPKEQLISELEAICFDNDYYNEYRNKVSEQAKFFSWQKCSRIIAERIKKEFGLSD